MLDVLFQTNEPTAAPGRVEFYDLHLLREDVNGIWVNIVRERHGWWDNESRGIVVDADSESLEKGFNNYSEALAWYCQRRHQHMNRNFIHSFMWHPITGEPAFYKRVEMF
jgi:hypothetical protein